MNPLNADPVDADSFESRLRNTPLRAAPPEWRQRILTAARSSQESPSSSVPSVAIPWWARGDLWNAFVGRISGGWLGFATVWALIFLSGQFDSWLNGTPSRTPGSQGISVRLADFGKYRIELMRIAELLPETAQPEHIPRPVEPPPAVRPRSQREILPRPFGGFRLPADSSSQIA